MNVGLLYKHELGYDDDNLPLAWEIATNERSNGRDFANIDGIIPDSVQNGTISYNVAAKRFPQSQPNSMFQTYPVTSSTERIPTSGNGAYWKYTWSGSELGQFWRMGRWQEYLAMGGKN